jgi:uncharacterized membrane protein YecN with MAPEG domain
MKPKSGNIRANSLIYKVIGNGNHKNAVVLNDEGDIGKYNRANRSLNHFVENSIPFILSILLGGYVYALPTFVLTIIFFIGRVIHQYGYAEKGYGGHAPGFGLILLSTEILNGLLLLVAIKESLCWH